MSVAAQATVEPAGVPTRRLLDGALAESLTNPLGQVVPWKNPMYLTVTVATPLTFVDWDTYAIGPTTRSLTGTDVFPGFLLTDVMDCNKLCVLADVASMDLVEDLYCPHFPPVD